MIVTTKAISIENLLFHHSKEIFKKGLLCVILGALCLSPSGFLMADFNREIILNVNSHPHPLPDLFTKELNRIYDEQKDNLEAEYSEYDLELPNKVTYFGFKEENNEVKVVGVIKCIKAKYGAIKLKLTYIACAKMEMIVDGVGLILKTYDSEHLASVTDADVPWYWDIILLGQADEIAEFLANIIVSGMSSIWDNPLENFEYKVLDIEVFNASSQAGIVEGVDPVLEAQVVLNSFPFDVFLEAKNDNLVINVDLLHGYYDEGGQFMNLYEEAIPSISPNPNLSWGGFGYNGDKYKYTQHWNPSLTYEERVDETMQAIYNMGLSHVRIEAVWKDIVPTIPDTNPSLNPDDIDDLLVDAYINEIEINEGWETIEYIIQSAVNHNLVPYVIVGCGHRDRPPKYDDGGLRTIAPGTVRGDSAENYIGVYENVYLYWLKLYSRAVVKKFSQDPWGVTIWQAENELNAARFAETYDWWRKGSAWADDGPGGFVETVAATLTDAIRTEEPTNAQIIQDFHMFNLARTLNEWKDYYDIAGINFYPNELYAMPVLGYMLGELVWATKRALQSISDAEGDPTIADRPVWVIETAYPAIEPAGTVEPEDYNDNIQFYSQERQRDFLEEALNSCAGYGADLFSWFLLTSPDDGSEWLNYSSINSYSGLFDPEGNPKLAYQAYIDAFQNVSDGELVTFANKYLEEDLGGSLTLPGIYNGLKSGQIFRLPTTEQFTIRTDNEWLEHTSETDTVKHHDWNEDPAQYKLLNEFTPDESFPYQNAQFEDTYPIHFQNNIPERQGLPLDIDIKDPWYVDAQGNQLNQFHDMGLVNDETNSYAVFLDQDSTLGMQYYTLRVESRFVATQSDIWVFDQWEVSPSNGAQISDINSLETDVVFKQTGVSITAKYEAVNQIGSYSLTINSGEILTVPAGANITFADGFAITVNGAFVVEGYPTKRTVFNWNYDDVMIHVRNVVEFHYTDIYGSGSPYSTFIEYDHIGTSNLLYIKNCLIKDSRIFVQTPITNMNISNNTFINAYFIADGQSSYSENVSIINNIFYYSTFIPLYGNETENYNLFYNTYLLPWYTIGENSISGNPLFVDSENGNYHLQTGSPCIDAGDPTSPLDPDGTPADIGAFYYYDAVPPSAPVLSISGSWGDHPTLSWIDGGEPDIDHFVLKKTYINDSGKMTWYIDISDGINEYTDNGIVIQKRGNTTAFYQVKAVDWIDQSSPYSNTQRASGLGPMWKEALPTKYDLAGNFPNPFNPNTIIKYALPEESFVELTIFDLIGREVKTVINGIELVGFKSMVWYSKDNYGNKVPSGVYIYRFSAKSLESDKEFHQTRKMVLLR